MFLFLQESKLEGFSRGLEPKEIVGASTKRGELHFLMTWQVVDTQILFETGFNMIFFSYLTGNLLMKLISFP